MRTTRWQPGHCGRTIPATPAACSKSISRGIARNEALRMITLGFFEPVITRFPGEALRDEIRTALDAKIDAATETA